MDAFGRLAVAVLLGAGLIFITPILGVLAGMLSGWVVGLFWSDMILGFLARCGMHISGLEVWQLGGAMGFLGGFLKTKVESGSK